LVKLISASGANPAVKTQNRGAFHFHDRTSLSPQCLPGQAAEPLGEGYMQGKKNGAIAASHGIIIAP
jgi:hypothetical protein